ncbi:MAG: TIGR03013 family PEP-CTERM/XrtA system glycosyltransferase [Gammaproteobacteria bacterium]|nr:MAG: TIGR03013 family PEP-CTERM/XrtA system glycosyltransferase [Gammaproteobacteria bacterium]
MFDIKIGDQHIKAPYLLLALADAVVLFISVYIAAYMRFFGELDPLSSAAENVGNLFPRALMHAAVVIVTLFSMGMYQRQRREHIVNKLSRLTVGFIIAFVAFGFIFYIFPNIYMGRGVFLIAASLSFVFLIIFHFIFSHTVNLDALKRNVLILGAGEKATWVTKLRRKSDRSGINVVGYWPVGNEAIKIQVDLLLDKNKCFMELIKVHEVDEVVVALTDRRAALPLKELMDVRLKGVKIVELVTFLERQLGKVYCNLLNPSWIIFSDGFKQDNIRYFTKRAFDLIASSILLVTTAPIYIFAVMMIWFESKGKEPVFYQQTRVGYGNKNFNLLKFRTMRSDAEQEGKAVWASQGDPRVTKIGKLLRIYRVDELPQIYNVFRGDMSLVGPRPERPEFVKQLANDIPFYSERHRVKPGLAGWAQMKYPYGSSVQDAIEKLNFDLYYVKHHSLIFDLVILLQTAEVILWGKGAR